MSSFHIGQEVTFKYTDAPVSQDAQYQIGQEVDIQEDGVPVAAYIVEEIDDTTIRGTVCKTAALPFEIDDSAPIPSEDPMGNWEYVQ